MIDYNVNFVFYFLRFSWPETDDKLDEEESSDIACRDQREWEEKCCGMSEMGKTRLPTNGVCYINGNYIFNIST